MIDTAAGQYALQSIDRLAGVKASTAAAAAKGAKSMTDAQIDKTAKDFESVFLSQMMEPMFGESVGEDMFGSEETDEIYKGLMVEQYGKKMVDSGGIGIAAYVRRELLKLQEV